MTAVRNARVDRDSAVVTYTQLLTSWNARDAKAFAALFARAWVCIGFDGSEMDGAEAIEVELAKVFAHHQTATYVAKVRSVRDLGADVVLLRAA